MQIGRGISRGGRRLIAPGGPPASGIIPIVAYYRARSTRIEKMYLKQSTASQSVLIGPFVDESDGVTAETGLTIANTDIRLSKNGGNIAAKNSGGATHDELGLYQITLDATDTNTVGRLQLMVASAGALPVYHEYEVLEEAVYDAYFAINAGMAVTLASDAVDATAIATGAIDADAIASDAITAAKIATDALTSAKFEDNAITAAKIATDAITAAKIAADAIGSSELADGAITAAKIATDAITAAKIAADAIGASELAADAVTEINAAQENIHVEGTCTTGGATTSIVASSLTPTSAVDDQFNGRIVIFKNDTTTTALRGQATDITDYTHSTLTLAVSALTTAPVSGDTFVIV